MTTDQRQQRKQIALLIAVRESCEDVREKMEAKQLRWLERGTFSRPVHRRRLSMPVEMVLLA